MMTEENLSMLDDWQELPGIDPAAVTAPTPVTIAGEEALLLKTPTGFRGVPRMCPHQDKPLSNSKIVADGKMIRCLFHGYTFKLEDGKGVNCPGFSIAVYEVREESGTLFARKRA